MPGAALLVLSVLVGGVQDAPPDVIAKATADLAQRLSVTPEQVALAAAWPMQWPDTSLGVREPGKAYAQVIVPGQSIVLRAADHLYAYHAADRGTVVFAGPYEEAAEAQLADLLASPPGDVARRAIEGTLVYRDKEALLYEGTIDAASLPETAVPALIVGPASQPFISQRWGDAEGASALVRVTGAAQIRALDRPGGAFGKSGKIPARIIAERIQVLPDRGSAPGVFNYPDLVARADELHMMVVTVRGSLAIGFEEATLGPLDPTGPDLPQTWVVGDLAGLTRTAAGGAADRTRVEVIGLFERRARFGGANGFGPDGKYPCRITVKALAPLGSVVDYPGLVSTASQRDGSVVAVRGLLFLGEGLSDLTALRPDDKAAPDPGCLVTGDLAGLTGLAEASGAGIPVQIVGRLTVAKEGEGYGRVGTRALHIESLAARPLTSDELPAAEGAAPALAYVHSPDGGAGTLTVQDAGGKETRLDPGVLGFALPAEPGDQRRLIAVPVPDPNAAMPAEGAPQAYAMELRLVEADGSVRALAKAQTVSCPAWSPDGRRVAAIIENEVAVLDATTGERVATGEPQPEGSPRITEFAWSPDSDAIAFNVDDTGRAYSMMLSLETLESDLFNPDAPVYGWLGEGRLLAFPGAQEPPDSPRLGPEVVASSCVSCKTGTETLMLGKPGETIASFAKRPHSRQAAIAVTSQSGGPLLHLYLADLGQDGNRRMLYAGAAEIRWLRWSPDGGYIAFTVRRGGQWRSVLLSANGARIADVGEVLPTAPAIVSR